MSNQPAAAAAICVERNGVILHVIGHVTVFTRQQLKDGFIAAVEEAKAERAESVWLDLSKAGTLDSSAIGALVSGAIRCQEAGKELIIADATPEFREVLEQLGGQARFTFAEDIPG